MRAVILAISCNISIDDPRGRRSHPFRTSSAVSTISGTNSGKSSDFSAGAQASLRSFQSSPSLANNPSPKIGSRAVRCCGLFLSKFSCFSIKVARTCSGALQTRYFCRRILNPKSLRLNSASLNGARIFFLAIKREKNGCTGSNPPLAFTGTKCEALSLVKFIVNIGRLEVSFSTSFARAFVAAFYYPATLAIHAERFLAW